MGLYLRKTAWLWGHGARCLPCPSVPSARRASAALHLLWRGAGLACRGAGGRRGDTIGGPFQVPTRNRCLLGETNCLIKTKRCDGGCPC